MAMRAYHEGRASRDESGRSMMPLGGNAKNIISDESPFRGMHGKREVTTENIADS